MIWHPEKSKIALIFLLLSVSTLSIAQTDKKAEPSWNCVDKHSYPKPTKPIVKAWTYTEYFSDSGHIYNGMIEANEIRKPALYKQEGLEHRWNFDLNESEGDFDAAFVIKPDGTGLYYYFGSEEKVNASLFTECKKTK